MSFTFRNNSRKPVTSIFVTNTYNVTAQTAGNYLNGTVTSVDQVADFSLSITGGTPLTSSYDVTMAASPMTGQPFINIYWKLNTTTGYKYPFKNFKYFSANINGKQQVKASVSRYRTPQHSIWTLGLGSGQSIASNTSYSVGIDIYGRHLDENFNIGGYLVTGDYTTPTITAGQSVDKLQSAVMSQIAKSINLTTPLGFPRNYGYTPMIVLGFMKDVSGVTATVNSVSVKTTLANIVAGMAAGELSIPVMNLGGTLKNITLSDTQLAGVIKAMGVLATDIATPANYAAAAGLVAIDTAMSDVAFNNVAPTYIIDGLIFVALDREEVAVDLYPSDKVNIRNVGFVKGFNNANSTWAAATNTIKRIQNAEEGSITKLWWHMYRQQVRQRIYAQNYADKTARVDEPEILFPNPVDLTKKYASLTFEHQDTELMKIEGDMPVSMFRTIILSEDATASNLVTPPAGPWAALVGSAAGSTLNNSNLINVTITSGAVVLGQTITGTGVPASTIVVAQITGTPGGAGIYALNKLCTATASGSIAFAQAASTTATNTSSATMDSLYGAMNLWLADNKQPAIIV